MECLEIRKMELVGYISTVGRWRDYRSTSMHACILSARRLENGEAGAWIFLVIEVKVKVPCVVHAFLGIPVSLVYFFQHLLGIPFYAVLSNALKCCGKSVAFAIGSQSFTCFGFTALSTGSITLLFCT